MGLNLKYIKRYVKAFILMFKAHKGQKDSGGNPYFTHPLRVSMRVKDKEYKILALVHDVLENSDKYSINDMSFLTDEEKEALLLITHGKDDDYFQYINKLKKNEIARAVKIAELENNMNFKRLKRVKREDKERYKRYVKAMDILLRCDVSIKKGE